MRKLERKNPKRFLSLIHKIDEVVENPEKGKPLKNPMQGFRRVHFDNKTFVLIYKIKEKVIIFEDLAHHDEVYK